MKIGKLQTLWIWNCLFLFCHIVVSQGTVSASVLLVVVCDLSLTAVPLSFEETVTVCSLQGNSTCLADGNRLCLNTDGEESCGNCLNGYIAIRGECYFIDDIDFSIVLDIIDTYAPQLTSNATDAQRVALLKRLALVVSFLQSRIPPLPFRLSLNKFSLDTDEERLQRLGWRYEEGLNDRFPRFDTATTTLRDRRARILRLLQTASTVPRNVDHVESGALTAVKDQGRCGCCYAVAVAAAVESAAYLTPTSGFLQSLSFQQLISCDSNNNGCNGGNIIYSMANVWQNELYADQGVGGLATLNDWPYTDKNGDTTTQCDTGGRNASVFLKEPRIVFTVNDNAGFEERVERLKVAVSLQPVPVVIKSACDLFSSYSDGVMTSDGDCACGEVSCIDHAVVMVGYDDTAVIPYWKLRNSWGTRWGEDGYFRIASEPQGAGEWGLFGVLAEAVIPLQAYNTTAAEPDALDEDKIEDWALIVIIVVGVLLIICLAWCLYKLLI